MPTLFDDLQEGLLQAIDYANGKGSARVTTYKIDPITEYNKDQIREIRMNAKMTQHVFADFKLFSNIFLCKPCIHSCRF